MMINFGSGNTVIKSKLISRRMFVLTAAKTIVFCGKGTFCTKTVTDCLRIWPYGIIDYMESVPKPPRSNHGWFPRGGGRRRNNRPNNEKSDPVCPCNEKLKIDEDTLSKTSLCI